MGVQRVHEGESNIYLGNVGIGAFPSERLTVNGNISSTGTHFAQTIFSNNYLGEWGGGALSGDQIRVEGVDIKSTTIPAALFAAGENFYLKAKADGTAEWDIIQDNEINFDNTTVDGDLTVRGDIIEYASGDVIYSKTSVFTKSLSSGYNNLNTFTADQFKTAKYVITLYESVSSSRTALEVLVTHNGTDAEGTTYGIVDAQATSLLSDISASVGTTINLAIKTSDDCTAIGNGVAHY